MSLCFAIGFFPRIVNLLCLRCCTNQDRGASSALGTIVFGHPKATGLALHRGLQRRPWTQRPLAWPCIEVSSDDHGGDFSATQRPPKARRRPCLAPTSIATALAVVPLAEFCMDWSCQNNNTLAASVDHFLTFDALAAAFRVFVALLKRMFCSVFSI